MSYLQPHLRKIGRVAVLSAALGLTLSTGFASTASAGSTSGRPDSPQPISNADSNRGGANGQCPGGAYCSTRDGSPSLNGNGDGKAVGKPAAGSVGRADNKNPRGQRPNGSDRNAGYECDRNNGIGKSNPAHTGCKPPVDKPPVDKPVVDKPVRDKPVVTPVVKPVVNPVVNPVVKPVAEVPVVVAGVEAGAVIELPAAVVVNPLPTSAAAGDADTDGWLAAGGLTGIVTFLVMGAGFVLHRRRGEV